jgi:hypothetical protein
MEQTRKFGSVFKVPSIRRGILRKEVDFTDSPLYEAGKITYQGFDASAAEISPQ